jgi:hypothetical protein
MHGAPLRIIIGKDKHVTGLISADGTTGLRPA